MKRITAISTDDGVVVLLPIGRATLTVDEARQLAEELTIAANVADGHWDGERRDSGDITQ